MELCRLRRELDAALKSMDHLGSHRFVSNSKSTLSIGVQTSEMNSNNEENLKATIKKLSEERDALCQLLESVCSQLDKDCEMCGSKDDKIVALRNMAKALESENELLIHERQRLERDLVLLKNQAQPSFKYNLVQDSTKGSDKVVPEGKNSASKSKSSLQQSGGDLDNCRSKWKEREESLLAEQRSMSKALQTLTKDKKELEERVQRLQDDNEGLSEQVRVSETRALSLEATVNEMRRDRRHSLDASFALEQRVAEQNSFYEASIGRMQDEIDATIEAVNTNKDREVQETKARYTLLFNEKVEELHAANVDLEQKRLDFKKAEERIRDLEETEKELQSLLNRTRTCMEEQYASSLSDLRRELSATQLNADAMEAEMANLRTEYTALQNSYRNSVQALQTRLYDIMSLIKSSDEVREMENEVDLRSKPLVEEEPKEEEMLKAKASNRRRRGKRRRGR